MIIFHNIFFFTFPLMICISYVSIPTQLKSTEKTILKTMANANTTASQPD